ncbi:hypothetical protein OAO34_03050 [Candidatus Poseidoniaceae archaeon]|nr:hypothetical protein [Candidatus Poseidoniaceae archaeon]
MMMGLLDRISTESQKVSFSRRPRKGRKVDEGRGQKLLDAIEEKSVPGGVILVMESEITRGGRQIGPALMFLIFGSVFCAIPIVMIIGSALGGALFIVPCVMIICIPFLWFGSRFVIAGCSNLFNPEPVEGVCTMHWFDKNHRFLAVIEHTTDPKTGQEFYPELLLGIYLKSTDEVAILYDPPSDGAVFYGDRRVCLWDPKSQEESFVILNLEWFEYGEEKMARKRARHFSLKLGLKFTLEINASGEKNWDVIKSNAS